MPTLYVFFGLIASGKSTLAARFAGRRDFAYFNTDLVRKELAGIDPVSRQPDKFNKGIYTREFSRKTYQELLDRAANELRTGRRGVVLDGSYASREERARVLELAASVGAGWVFIQCVCSDQAVRERLAVRARDPLAVSDGRWEIYLRQKERFQPPSELDPAGLITVNTEQSVDELEKQLAATLDAR
ncbi:MAG: AAA family ATPase [Desulfobulbaceae bacterium]|nr:AAA family ATPase [Desulfobulbaceae bacterium]